MVPHRALPLTLADHNIVQTIISFGHKNHPLCVITDLTLLRAYEQRCKTKGWILHVLSVGNWLPISLSLSASFQRVVRVDRREEGVTMERDF